MDNFAFIGFYSNERHTVRITTKEWKEHLLLDHDRIIVFGRNRLLKARRLGAGLVEVYLKKDDGKGWYP